MRHIAIVVGVLVWLGVAHGADRLVIAGGTLIGSGGVPAGPATLVIEDGLIARIVDGASIDWPADTRVIDARGAWVMPGLADMHNHLRSGLFRPAGSLADVLEDLLSWGITTTFDPGVPADEYGNLRAAINADPARYPRAFLIEEVFTADGGWGHGLVPGTPAEARHMVRELHAAGSDGVKLIYDDMRWATTRPFAVMDIEIAAAIIDEAHRHGMIAVVHAPVLPLAKQILAVGADCLMHGIVSAPVDSEFIVLMKRNNACYVSTLAMFQTNAGYAAWAKRLEEFDIDTRLDADAMELFNKVKPGTARLDNTAWTAERLPILRDNLVTLHDAGIPLMIGTDTGIPGVLAGIAAQLEIVMHVEAGLSPDDVLRAATAVPARVMGREGEFGTLTPGASADVLVLDADPRADINNIRRIRYVLRAGRVVRQ